VPRKLSRGKQFAADVRAEFELNAAEEVVLETAAAAMDRHDKLPADALIELRLHELVILRAIAALALPEVPGARGVPKRPTTTRLKAAKAARVRWSREIESA
jgi:hypothetical protein